jgi:hypothetical protein
VPGRAALFGILYAILEGFCLGAISACSTPRPTASSGPPSRPPSACVAVALFLYATRIIRPTRGMAFAVAAGIGGLMLLYLFVFVLSIFNWSWLYLTSSAASGSWSPRGRHPGGDEFLPCSTATIEAGVEAGAPKQLEWYMASLTVTLVWLYLSSPAAQVTVPQPPTTPPVAATRSGLQLSGAAARGVGERQRVGDMTPRGLRPWIPGEGLQPGGVDRAARGQDDHGGDALPPRRRGTPTTATWATSRLEQHLLDLGRGDVPRLRMIVSSLRPWMNR